MIVDGVDLMARGRWDAYALGYQWGITYGIDMGRQELAAELMPIGTVIADLKLWRGATFAELQRRRTTYSRPALSAEQLHAQAVASWASQPFASTSSTTASRPA